ncbi:heptaprenyl diphosphate synthase component 1 [Paucisalibacillus sp. EB02]|uniref:heptaprenyl diphosphate synthase component 1 n=1 Tax=Paucisalibacillus sp. EB02 TaxID=1347087 RepID=UPI0018CBF3B4|nr:heptaprenyl diphosphate synthase component 1 [Paucisalibacillus sp. EB02]
MKLQIEETVHHSFLIKHIPKPEVDEYKLYFLHYILNKTILAPNVKEQLIITTMLVQTALDIHENIPDYTGVDRPSIGMDSQLSILAGDYFSGLYYSILANIEEREYITLLATAIKQINELKMNLYYMENETPEDYLETRKQIQSLLIKYIAEHVQVVQEIHVIEEILFTNEIINNITNSFELEKQDILEKQVNKTKGMIDKLSERQKQDFMQILDSIIYQHTSSEME